MPDKYSDLIRPLTDEEFAVLKGDIIDRGIIVPIIVDKKGEPVDGYHRAKIALELGIACPTITVEGTPKKLREMAVALNVARRQIKSEDWKKKAEELRAEGKSTRTIAKLVGVSHVTVHRQMFHMKQHSPSQIIGATGKRYPAKREATNVTSRPVTGIDGKTYSNPPRPTVAKDPVTFQFLALHCFLARGHADLCTEHVSAMNQEQLEELFASACATQEAWLKLINELRNYLPKHVQHRVSKGAQLTVIGEDT